MNQAEICKALILAGGIDSFDALIAATGLGETRLSAHLNKLCGEGVLTRDRAQVKIKNQAKCSAIAMEGAKDEPQEKPRAPSGSLNPMQAKPRPTIPVGLSVFKGVPIPEKRTAARPIALDFASMEIGDCFLVPVPAGVEVKELSNRVSAEYNAYRNRISPAFSAAVRSTVFPEGHPQFGEPCVGVWRIQPAGPAVVEKPAPKGKKKAA